MKKISVGIISLSLLASPVFSALAQTGANASLMQTLQMQLAALRAQVQALSQARTQVLVASNAVAETVGLLRNLREGMSGDDVKTLQAILAKYPDLYPEGLVTGFFGKATARAVARFQAREQLPVVGLVGPRTLEKLLKELEKDPLDREDDEDDHGEKRLCAIVPPGHLIAPGWLRKHDGIRPIVPPCQKLPGGIEGRIGATVITDVAVSAITNSSARILWKTNRPATGIVWYGTASPVMRTGSTLRVSSSVMEKEHNLALTGLSSNTTYYYVIESTNEDGQTSISAQYSFTTSQNADVTSPVIFNVAATGVTNTSAHIIWKTDETADSAVWYSVSSPIVVTATTSLVASANVTLAHDLTLSGLNHGTVYYYMAGSKDASGNLATSAQYSFTTLGQ